MNEQQFIAALKAHDITLTDTQVQQFDLFYERLIETNNHLNLTTITARQDVYLKHFYDSLTPAFYLPDLKQAALTLCDVGAGAGFPTLPLKIAFPELKVTLVDSLNKRVKFLVNLIEELQLKDVTVHHARAEEFGGKRSAYREAFDLVTARAVARMSILSELCLPLVKVGGRFVALKAAQTKSELDQGAFAIQTLGGQVVLDQALTLPESGDSRHIVVVEKKEHTPTQYPRKAGTPNKEPLGED